MSHTWVALLSILFAVVTLVAGQQQCYFGPGAENRGPSSLVPCMSTGESACCLLGDTCLSGNTCYNYTTGDLYQYGCTDITYQDASCPYKCGWNTTLSPWTALEYCADVTNVTDTWVCHAPESCGCEWPASDDLLILQPRGCKEMGTDARVALYAPSTLAPYVSLPVMFGGNTSYYSPTTISGTSTWVSTAIPGYTPATITPLTEYGTQPSSAVLVVPGLNPSPSTVGAAVSVSATSTPVSGSAATTTSSSGPGSSTVVASSSSGLSTDAKIGIGVGIAGGVLLLAAVAAAFFLWGRLHKHRQVPQNQEPERQQGSDYPQSPPMQSTQYFSPGNEKPPGWQEGYFPNQVPQQYPFFDPHQAAPYYGAPAMYAGSPPPDERLQANRTLSPRPPTELSAERRVSEMDSVTPGSPPTPSPAYADIDRTRK